MKLPKGNEMALSSKGTMDMISNAYILQWATICFTSGLKLVSRDMSMSPKFIWDIVLNFKKHSLTLPASYRAAVDSIVRSK